MIDEMTDIKRTHYTTELSNKDISKTVVVCGFVQKVRDKGNLVFVDLRDRTGIIQLSFNDKTEKLVISKAKTLKAEYVIMAVGVVISRESINKDIETGDIEIIVEDLKILSISKTPPFHISDDVNVNDELRLKYRYLDLRRPELQKTIMMRHKITKCVRDFFDQEKFLEIETPLLIKSTPEGARDYLVPSRVHKGSFFALPQSPQLYKQLLMVSGYDRYFQIARCFRDEDLRADRQPEFTQIDVEMSFVEQQDVININEKFIQYIFKHILDKDISLPIPRIEYKEAMERFGSDKPDIRFGLELVDISDIVVKSEFKVFSGAVESGGSVRGINISGGFENISRKDIDKLTSFAKTYKAKGVAFTRIGNDNNSSSSYEKFLSQDIIDQVRDRLSAKSGDVILIVGDTKDEIVFDSLGALRLEIAKKLNLIKEGSFAPLWVTDFPLFEYDEEKNRLVAKHHPFTSVKHEDIKKLDDKPLECRANAYDFILNGCEIGGGSIRISDSDMQSKMFNLMGFEKEEIDNRFGFLLEAFKYGVPPHGGIAYGLDRLVMILLEKDSIKDVIAFPKVQNSSELLSGCPTMVDKNQLEELGIECQNKEKE